MRLDAKYNDVQKDRNSGMILVASEFDRLTTCRLTQKNTVLYKKKETQYVQRYR